MRYLERIEHNLHGLSAVSTGLCPDCDDCRSAFGDFDVHDTEDAEMFAFRHSEGLSFPTEELAEEAARVAFAEAVEFQDVLAEGSFQRGPCDICDSRLGGNYFPWHAVTSDDKILHGESACMDCVVYLANGDVPEEEPEEEPEAAQ